MSEIRIYKVNLVKNFFFQYSFKNKNCLTIFTQYIYLFSGRGARLMAQVQNYIVYALFVLFVSNQVVTYLLQENSARVRTGV